MLIISRKQMHCFEEASWLHFFDRVIERARIELPEACRERSKDDLRAFLRDVLHGVQAHGILLGDDMQRLGLLAMRIGMNPAGHQDLGPILRDPGLVGASKVDALERAAEVIHGAH